MTTIREAYLAFADYSKRQQQVVQAIQSELRESRAQIGDTTKALEKQVASLYPSHETFPVEALTLAAQDAGLPHNFTLSLSGMLRENAQIQKQRLDILAEHGSMRVLADERKILNGESLALEGKFSLLGKDLTNMERHLSHVDRFLNNHCDVKAATDAQIKSGVAYYSTPSFARYFSPDWWQGNKAIKDYREKYGDPEQALKNRRDTRIEQELLGSEISTIGNHTAAITKITDRMDELERQFIPDKKIASALQAHLVDALFDDKFIDALAVRVGKDVAEPLAATVLKILNLTKIEKNLASVLGVAEGTQEKIDQPLYKLGKAEKRYGSRDIDLDVQKTGADLAAHQQYAQSFADNTQKMRKTIDQTPLRSSASQASYPAYSGPDSSTGFMNWWIFMHIMDHSGADHKCVHQVLGNVDVGRTSLESLNVLSNDGQASQGGALNDIANNSFKMPDIHALSVPDVSVPDFVMSASSGSGYSPSFSYGGGSDGGSDGGGGGGGGE